MNSDNAKKLQTNFPVLYPPFDPNYPQGPHNTEFRFSVGDGWFQLLFDLSTKLEPLCRKEKGITAIQNIVQGEFATLRWPHATQVKSKFAALRFYVSYSTDEMEEHIQEAETLSRSICIECGMTGRMRDNGMRGPFCDQHFGECLAVTNGGTTTNAVEEGTNND
jgi:hypothetical protein